MPGLGFWELLTKPGHYIDYRILNEYRVIY